MEEFMNNLSSPSWWAGVVIIGILLNVLSGYLKDGLDKGSSRVSRWWANRSEKSRKERNELLNSLRNDKQEQILLASREIILRLQSIAFLVVGVLFFFAQGSFLSFFTKCDQHIIWLNTICRIICPLGSNASK